MQNIRINVPSTFTVGVSTEEAIMNNAAERLLNLAQDDVESMAREIIFGQLRLTVASLTIEQINQDREKFLDAIRRNVAPELNKIGLYLINVNITDITDESGYIESIGKKAASEAINQAKVDVSDQDRKGSVGEAEQVRERTVKVAQYLAESEKGKKQAEADKRVYVQAQETLATIGEAEANRDMQIKVAENLATSEKGQKKAEAEKRIFIEAQEADAIAGENRAKALIAASNAELSVQAAQAAQRSQVAQFDAKTEIQKAQARSELQRLTAEEVVRQQIEKQKITIAADATRRKPAAKRRAKPTRSCSSTKPRRRAFARCSKPRRRVTRRSCTARTMTRAPRPRCCSPKNSSRSSRCRSRPSRRSRSTRSRCGMPATARTARRQHHGELPRRHGEEPAAAARGRGDGRSRAAEVPGRCAGPRVARLWGHSPFPSKRGQTCLYPTRPKGRFSFCTDREPFVRVHDYLVVSNTSVMDTRADELLAIRCQLGERDAFDALIARWHEPLWRYLRRLANDGDVARDLVQDTWVRVLRGIAALREPDRLRPWLFGIARRVAMDRLRAQYVRGIQSDAELDALPANEADVNLEEQFATLDSSIAALPIVERETVTLFYLRELSIDEIASPAGRARWHSQIATVPRPQAVARASRIPRSIFMTDQNESLAAIRRLAFGELSLRARLGYVALLLVATAMSVVILALWFTEPALPMRTQVGVRRDECHRAVVGGVCALGAHHATRSVRSRPRHRGSHGGGIHVAVPRGEHCAVAVKPVAAAFGALGTGVLMLAAALAVLVRARRRFAELAARRAQLERASD